MAGATIAAMSDVLLFPSVLGVRPGITALAARLEVGGHHVQVVDWVGRVYDDYGPAMESADRLTMADRYALVDAALADRPAGVVVGISAGGAMAQAAALRHPVSACVVLGGAVALHWFEADAWPAGVALQLHGALDDPWREADQDAALLAAARAAGAPAELYEYLAGGHLFFDPSLPAEYDEAGAQMFTERLLQLLDTGTP